MRPSEQLAREILRQMAERLPGPPARLQLTIEAIEDRLLYAHITGDPPTLDKTIIDQMVEKRISQNGS